MNLRFMNETSGEGGGPLEVETAGSWRYKSVGSRTFGGWVSWGLSLAFALVLFDRDWLFRP